DPLMEWDKERSVRMLSVYRDVIANFIGAHGGRVLAGGERAITAEFPAVSGAVEAATDFQRGLAARNAPLSPRGRLEFGVGVVLADELPGRDPVALASKLRAAAGAGGICISAGVHHEIAGKIDLPFVQLGRVEGADVQAFRAAPPLPRVIAESRGK